jgi:hypothetical protein
MFYSQCGSTLYARLEIWKAACAEADSQLDMSGPSQWNSSNNSSGSSGELSEGEWISWAHWLDVQILGYVATRDEAFVVLVDCLISVKVASATV